MNEYLKQMIAHGHAEVETYPLAQLQGKVNQILRYRDFLAMFTDTIPYEPKPRYWLELIENEEN